MPTLAFDPTTSKEVPLLPSAFDFVVLLDISDSLSLSRMHDIMAKELSGEISPEDVDQRDKKEDQNLREQIHHRIVGFLDNWPPLKDWFTMPKNILREVNAETDEGSVCQRVKEIFSTEIVNKKIKVEKKLEEKEAEKKAAAALAETPIVIPPPPSEAEKEKETHPRQEPPKTYPGKGKAQSGD